MHPGTPLARRSPERRFRLNDWTVEPGRNQLVSYRGEAVRLEPKAMEVLAYLAGRPRHVVAREELLQALWPGVIVGDDSLTQTVIKLRKALDDSARDPRYIETIPKRGYRLLAAPCFEDEGRRRQRRWPAWSALACLALLATSAIGPVPEPSTVARNLLAFTAMEATEQPRELRRGAAGLSAELHNALANTRGVRLASSQAAGADYVLSGEVQQVGGEVRVLVRVAERGIVIWSERFEVSPVELASHPERVARRVATALSATLSEHEKRRAAQRYTGDVDAFALFQSGREASAWRGEGDGAAARERFGKAIAKDPAFARAYAATAVSYVRDYRYGYVPDGTTALRHAHAHATTALQIDPQLPEAHFALAYLHLHQREHALAQAHLDEALKLNSGYADAYGLKAHVYLDLGRAAEALPLVRTAMRLAAEPAQIHFLLLGRAYYFIGDPLQAQINLREAKARNPADLEARLYLALTLAELGKRHEAEWEAEEIRALQPSYRAASWLDRYPLADERLRRKLAVDLARVGL